MARSMRDIKRQIKSVQNTRQITKAMEMVAASKLRKAQEKAEAARPYSEKLKEVVRVLLPVRRISSTRCWSAGLSKKQVI